MPYARTPHARLATAAAAVAVVVLAGCGGGPSYKKTGITRTLPSLTGQPLTAARSAAAAAGFGNVSVADATGAKRGTAAGDWKVCFQKPGSGKADTGIPVRLSVTGLTEACPAKDRSGAAPKATATRTPTRRSSTTRHSSSSGGSVSKTKSKSRSRSRHH